MQIAGGYGGWLRVSGLSELPFGAVVYTRFHRDDETGRLVPGEMYLEVPAGERIRGEHLRKLPLDRIEAFANAFANDHRELVEERMQAPGPDLSTLASYLMHRWDMVRGRTGAIEPADPAGERDWVQDAFWSQVPGSGVPHPGKFPIGAVGNVVLGRPRKPRRPLTAPPGGRYTERWYRQLAAAYSYAVDRWRNGHAEAPAKALAAEAGVSVNTVRSWIYRARKAGFLPKGEQGKAG